MMIGTCGHEVTLENGGVSLAEYNREGERCVSSSIVCEKCQKFFSDENLILKTPEDEKNWMKNGEYPS